MGFRSRLFGSNAAPDKSAVTAPSEAPAADDDDDDILRSRTLYLQNAGLAQLVEQPP
jgi:hypothetical protein